MAKSSSVRRETFMAWVQKGGGGVAVLHRGTMAAGPRRWQHNEKVMYMVHRMGSRNKGRRRQVQAQRRAGMEQQKTQETRR